jgi:hypothetical protein
MTNGVFLDVTPLSFSETSVLTRATRRNIPEDDIVHSNCVKPQILHSFPLWGGYSSTHTATRNATDQAFQYLISFNVFVHSHFQGILKF